MIKAGMHMEGVFWPRTMSKWVQHVKWWWNKRKIQLKNTLEKNVLHKIIYFSFRMTFQTYLWDSRSWVQAQSESHDSCIRARPTKLHVWILESTRDKIVKLCMTETGSGVEFWSHWNREATERPKGWSRENLHLRYNEICRLTLWYLHFATHSIGIKANRCSHMDFILEKLAQCACMHMHTLQRQYF